MQPKKVLKQSLAELDSIYLLYGEDQYLLDEFIDRFKEQFIIDEVSDFDYNLIKEAKNQQLVPRIINAVETLPFKAKKRLVIIHTYNLFTTQPEGEERLLRLLADFPTTAVALFVSYKEPDKRRKLYNEFKQQGTILEFDAPRYQELDHWVKRRVQAAGKEITAGALKLLEKAFSQDLQQLENELSKVITFIGQEQLIERQTVKAVISQDWLVEEDIIFDFVDAIGRQQTAEALNLLQDVLDSGSDPKQILGMIARQVRLMLQTKLLSDRGWQAKKIADQLNQHPYPIKKSLKQSHNFTVESLEQAMERLAEADYKLVTGADQELELERLVIDLKETR